MKPIFNLQKKVIRQICFKVHYFSSAEFFKKLNEISVFDYYIVELRSFFLNLVLRVIPTEYRNSLYERKVFDVQTRKAQLNLLSLPNESGSVSRNSLRYRGAKLINCLIETGLDIVDFSIRIKRKTLEHMQHVIVKDQISNIIFH